MGRNNALFHHYTNQGGHRKSFLFYRKSVVMKVVAASELTLRS